MWCLDEQLCTIYYHNLFQLLYHIIGSESFSNYKNQFPSLPLHFNIGIKHEKAEQNVMHSLWNFSICVCEITL